MKIAYRVAGQGSLDLLLVPCFLSNLDILPEDPGYERLVKRLSAFGRLILFDRCGTGLSDRSMTETASSFAATVDDIGAVMDAAGSTRAVLIGMSEGTALSVMFATARPERVRSLVLFGGFAHFHASVMDSRKLRALADSLEASWGRGALLSLLAPDRADDRRFADWWARLERLSASPTDAIALMQANAMIDVRDLLANVLAPTLVIHRVGDTYANATGGRQIARAIARTRLVELPGRDHLIWMGDVDRVADLIEEFLTGARPVAHDSRVLVAILVAHLGSEMGAIAAGARLLDERMERLREAAPKVLERHGGHGEWFGSDRIMARFETPTRAAAGAVALREAATALGISVVQGIHVGELDVSVSPLRGLAVDVALEIAGLARSPDILLSRLTSELVLNSGLQFSDRGSHVINGLHDPLSVVVLASERHLEPIQRKPHAVDLTLISGREREVLALVAEGLSNTLIAVQLGLSEHTVKRHVANILLKLDLPSRAAAAALVARLPLP